MAEKPINIWGTPNSLEYLEDRLFVDMAIIEGVLEVVSFADYVDRRCGDVIDYQLTDQTIHRVCFGAAHIAHDASECIELLIKSKREAGEL